MAFKNTTETYGSISKFLHWVIAALVIIMLIVGVSFNYLSPGPLFSTLMYIHKSTGVTILILMVFRLIWRMLNKFPRIPDTIPEWQKIIAYTQHKLFYIFLIAMPITGILMSLSAGHPVSFWGLFTIKPSAQINKPFAMFMSSWHECLAWAIFIMIVIHVSAAFKHHFIHKDNVLKRMLPGDHHDKTTHEIHKQS